MDKKTQLANVAFGGNWSEQLLRDDELHQVLDVIATAVTQSLDRDVEDEALLNAMLYIRKNVEKGPLLCAAFFKALRIENQGLRYDKLCKVEYMIRTWAGAPP